MYLIQEVHRKRRDEIMIKQMSGANENTPNDSQCNRHDCEMCKNQKECIEYTSEKIMKQNMEAYKRLAK